AISNVQGSATVPAGQDVTSIIHAPACALGSRLRSLYIIHRIQDDPAALWKFLSQFFKFFFSGNPHRIPPHPYIHFFRQQAADKSSYSGPVRFPHCRSWLSYKLPSPPHGYPIPPSSHST